MNNATNCALNWWRDSGNYALCYTVDANLHVGSWLSTQPLKTAPDKMEQFANAAKRCFNRVYSRTYNEGHSRNWILC